MAASLGTSDILSNVPLKPIVRVGVNQSCDGFVTVAEGSASSGGCAMSAARSTATFELEALNACRPAVALTCLDAGLTYHEFIEWNKAQLDQTWRALFGTERPRRVCGTLLIKALGYRLQERAIGGLKPATRSELERLGRNGSEQGFLG